ncbi:MAG: LPP20 family lipoprotein [Nitrospirae bacterium]|nr:LPP20 family lipoprotein [Candidatus Troglogloeales bacterium]
MTRDRGNALLVSRIVLWAGFALVVGCSSTPKRPDWIMKGAGAFPKEKSFYGVGAVSGVKNIPLAYRAADNQARADIAKQFDIYTASLMKQYAASTAVGDMSKSSEEQNIEEATKTFTAISLSGIQIVDHHEESSKDGIPTIYSLAKLDLERVKENMEQAKELSAEVRDSVRKNADKSFDNLEKEEAKQK